MRLPSISALLNCCNVTDDSFLDFSESGVWLFRLDVQVLVETYRIHFRKKESSLDNYIVTNSIRNVDHSVCNERQRHEYCRIKAKCTDRRQTRDEKKEEWVPVSEIRPQKPKKNKGALIVRGLPHLIGRVVIVKAFTGKLREACLVYSGSNKSDTWREDISNMTFISKHSESGSVNPYPVVFV